MFESNRLDKLRRGVKKYRDGDSSAKVVDAIKRPLYCCILLLLLILGFCIYFALFLNKTHAHSSMDMNNTWGYSDNVINLRNKFITQYKLASNNPYITTHHKLLIPENDLFTRTKTIQYLYDYVEAANKDIYKEEYVSNDNKHHVKCIETFTPRDRSQLSKFETAVQQFLNNEGALFTQHIAQSYIARTKISAENCGGLSKLIGQTGIVTRKDIRKFTAVGHYYGDEYLLDEFEEQFPWDKYGGIDNHPFRRKWDYYMTIPYHIYADKRLHLDELNITMAMDSFHSYNYAAFVKDGGQDLTKEESKLKQNLETFVNDAREQLYEKKLSKHDLIRKNSEFVYCSVDGILMTFLVVTKDLKKNQQLFVYYGPNYG
eukprot:244682_1